MGSDLKNIIVFFFSIIIIFIFFTKLFPSGNSQNADGKVLELTPQLSAYILNESEYKNSFHSDRNIVFYVEECPCPYSRMFVSKLSTLIKSKKYANTLNFIEIPKDRSVITMSDKEYREYKELKENNVEQYNDFIANGMSPIEDILPESKGKYLNEFYSKCSVFCIVHRTGTKMVKYNGVGKDETDQLEEILDKYSNNDW